ncbi:MAG: nucleotide exchange factor GrpE [Lachnospiraceae bacterium]|jgi:molecular chaperone GrpE|nr:nucleotide exchange factor GrpE [Lachnospiraceae bacterium]
MKVEDTNIKNQQEAKEESLSSEQLNEERQEGFSNEAENQNSENQPEDGNPAEEPAGEEADSQEKEKEKKGFFHKKEKKDQKDEKIEELTDRLKRTMAEFDNFRKRTEKEKSAMYEIGAKDIIEKILPVVDNFERGLAAIPEDAKETAFAEGMEKIYKQFMKTLEEIGVTPIEAVGKEFDPNFHNAVMHVEDENFGENVISMELQKGYLYRDSVVRHSMVQVAN